MRKPSALISLSVLSLAIGLVHAADAALDMDLMQNVEDVNKSLASNIALRDAGASAKDAEELHTLFQTVEKHYLAKPEAPDGLALSRKSLQLTEKIQQQVGAQDFGGASGSATELSRTCRACHTFYKQS
ncbi:hypothetical protein [uncultured Aquabacterium sp.]|uniref:hypothetical protein n=1 Tax=Aquabacterium sp. TaxID=1872578 RepID=UPI0025FC8A70|nr:hypothetical protein [uncultured Aquabacterium sp.]